MLKCVEYTNLCVVTVVIHITQEMYPQYFM